jgi:hypothetical protein
VQHVVLRKVASALRRRLHPCAEVAAKIAVAVDASAQTRLPAANPRVGLDLAQLRTDSSASACMLSGASRAMHNTEHHDMKRNRSMRPLRYQLHPLVVSVTVALASWSAAGLAGDKVHEHKVQYNEAYQTDASSGTQAHVTRHGMKDDEQSGKAVSQTEGGAVWNFDRLDKDGDDRLSEAEFDAYAAPAAPGGGAVPSSPHQVDALREFESIDDDKDGFVTRAEMKSARKAFDDAADADMKKSGTDQS